MQKQSNFNIGALPAALLFALALSACSDSEALIPGDCVQGNCENGSGTMNVVNGNYTGQFQDGERHGYGTMQYSDGARYTGEWRDDVRHGQGTYEIVGGRYTGEFIDGEYSGYGTYTYTIGASTGQQFTGEWAADSRSGFGVFTTPDGRTFVGEYDGNELQGYGYSDRRLNNSDPPFEYRYFGTFKSGKFHGRGVLIWPEGDTFFGQFVDGERKHGVHSYQRSPDLIGEKYIGSISEGKFHGQGIYIFANGRRYVGEFVYGQIEGFGTLYYRGDDPDYTHYEGQFIQGSFEGAGTLYYKSGARFEGEFRDGLQWSGTLLDASGNSLEKLRDGKTLSE